MRLIDADALMRSIDINWGCNKCKAQCVDEWGVCSCVVHQLKEIVMTAPTISQWIPVSERLPDVSDRVMVSLKTDLGEWIETDFVDPYGTKAEPWTRHWSCDVTAWMPLPEPYKEGDTE